MASNPQSEEGVSIMEQDSVADNGNPTRTSAAVAGLDDDRKLFVGGLHRDTTDSRLREYFGKFGEIESITIKSDPQTGQSRGFGFIVFSKPETIERLLGLDHWIDNRKVDTKKVSKEFQRGKLFVGGLTQELSDDDIKNYFSQFGNIVDIQTPFDKTKNQRKGFCFITFESKEVVNKLLKNPKVCINGKWVDLRKAVSNPEALGGGAVQSEKIFVGGLTPDITDVEIKEHFSKFGTVIEVQSPYDKAKSQRKAFCFITFDSKEAVYELLKEPKQVINGKQVDLRIAVTNPEAIWGPNPNGRQTGGKIFVGGLTPDMSDLDIRKFFSQYGPVLEIQSPYDKEKGQRKGFCFVSFASKDTVRKLLTNPVRYINGKKVDLRSADQDNNTEDESGDWPGRFGGFPGADPIPDYGKFSELDYAKLTALRGKEIPKDYGNFGGYPDREIPKDYGKFGGFFRGDAPKDYGYPGVDRAQNYDSSDSEYAPMHFRPRSTLLGSPSRFPQMPQVPLTAQGTRLPRPPTQIPTPHGPLTPRDAVPRVPPPVPKPQRDNRPFFRYQPY